MPKPKINVKEVLADIRSGASDGMLMEKYGISAKGLESLFNKLIEANVLTAEEVSRRSRTGSGVAPVQRRESTPRSPEPVAQPEIDPQLAAAAVELLKQGSHDNELMGKLGLSPSQLKKLKEELVRLGYVSAAESAQIEPHNTKQCRSCGREITEDDTRCGHCGYDPTQPVPQMPAGPTGRRAPEMSSAGPSVEKYCEWEDSRDQGTLRAFFQTASRCLLTPASFFSALPLDSGYWSPLLFSAMSLVVAVVFGYLWIQLLIGGLGGVGLIGLIFAMGCTFVGAVVAMPVVLLFWSGLIHGMLCLLQGAQGGFQATFRVVSYSSVTAAFNAVPVVGQLASLWGFVLNIIGLRETHETSTGKAAAAVLVPAVLLVMISLLAGGATALLAGSKAAKARKATTPTTYTGQRLPSEVCEAIDAFLVRVDSVAASGKLEGMQSELQAAGEELGKMTAGLKDEGLKNHVTQLAGGYLGVKIAFTAFQQKFGKMPGLDKLEKKQEEIRAELHAMCGK